ncbi:MAG: metal-dependent hydrolase [Noviherbaspirillum sp.]
MRNGNGIPTFAAAAFLGLLAACGTTEQQAAPPPSPIPVPAAAAAAPAPAVPIGKVQVQWLGQAATRITTPGGKVIVIDPWLSTNPNTPEQYKRLEALGRVDLILVTHAHFDHMADAPALAKLNNVPVYGPAGMNQAMTTLGILPTALSQRFGKGGTVMPLGPGIRITATQAEHSSELLWRNPATGKDELHVGGEPVGFLIELENGFRIYHMGDTGLFGDMRMIGDYYKPDLVLIPIGGHFTMDPKDAALATRDLIRPKYAIPIHYGTSPQLAGKPEDYISTLGNVPTRVLPLKPGEAALF